MNCDTIYLNWFYHIEGIGRKKLLSIVETAGSARAFYEEYVMTPGLSFLPRPELLTQRDMQRITEYKQKTSPEALWRKLKRQGITVADSTSPYYPEKLIEIPDPPVLLYMRLGEDYVNYKKSQSRENDGREPDLSGGAKKGPVVAVIGARVCSEYGRMVAARIGRLCAQMGIGVCSGMAVGIDGIAQLAAAKAGGDVTAVLGSGVDICYPTENAKLYDMLWKNGKIISEYPPGTTARPGNFPQRNRIISGMADAVIVVEAKEKSGTMITVDMALEQGRQVYIIPGRLSDPISAGCNRLISQGAEIIWNLSLTLDTILADYEKSNYGSSRSVSDVEREAADNEGKQHEMHNEMRNEAWQDSSTRVIIQALDFYPQTVQDIYEKIAPLSEISFTKLSEKLLELELFGRICQEGGRFYKKGT